MKGSTLLIIGGIAAAYLYLSKAQGDGGQGGSLSIPDLGLTGSGSPVDFAGSTATQSTSPLSPMLNAFMPTGANGAPLTSEKKAVSSAIAGYGDSGVYVSQPTRNPTGNTGGIGLLPFGSSTDYQPAPSVSIGGGIRLGANSPIGTEASGYHVAKKASVSVAPTLDFGYQGGGNYTGVDLGTAGVTVFGQASRGGANPNMSQAASGLSFIKGSWQKKA